MPGFFFVGREEASFIRAAPPEMLRVANMRKQKRIFCPDARFGTCIATE
jgi:hypothetical protein